MDFDISQFNSFLEQDQRLAYEMFAILEDATLHTLIISNTYPEFFTPIGINAIYSRKVEKMPFTKDEKEAITYLQRITRIPWKNIYTVLTLLLQNNVNIDTGIKQYAADNDVYFPYELSKIIGRPLDAKQRYQFQDNSMISYYPTIELFYSPRPNLIKYLVDNDELDITDDSVEYSLQAKDLNWFKTVLQMFINKYGSLDDNKYSDLIYIALINGSVDIVKYIVEDLGKIPNQETMSYVASENNPELYYYLIEHGAPPYDPTFYLTEIGNDLPDFI